MATTELSSLADLRVAFRRSTTSSMPLAGTLLWSIAAVLSLILPIKIFAVTVAAGSGLIVPLAMLLDRLRGRNLIASGGDNPLMGNFLRGIVVIGLLWPFVILAGLSSPLLIVLGAAILMALIWIPYGWSAEDPVGLQHAVGRCTAAYGAYLFVPHPWTALAICMAVIGAYLFSFARMRRN